MMINSQFEEVQMACESMMGFAQQTDQIFAAEHEGNIDSEDADMQMASAIEQLAESLYEILDVEVPEEEMEDSAEMSSARRYADFSTAFGATLAQLIDAQYPGQSERGIYEVAQAAGISTDDVESALAGELVVDAATAATIAEALGLDRDVGSEFVQLANSAYVEADGEEAYEEEPVAAMSADLALRAEFEQLKERSAVAETLRKLERQADFLVQSGSLTPHERRVLLGDFDEQSDRVAAFSAACTDLHVPVGQQLDRIEYYLFVAQQRGPIAFFGQVVDEPMNDRQELYTEDLQAVQDYRRRNGYR